MSIRHLASACAVAMGLSAACRAPATTTAGVERAPSSAAPVVTAGAAGADTARGRRGYTEADVRFMQRMIGHHAQALTMASLVPARTRRDDLRLIAERILVSQRDEIATMRRWLRAREEAAPDAGATTRHPTTVTGEVGHPGHPPAGPGQAAAHDAMPGMATAAELEALARLSGPAFDARFLDLMIRHHEGALTMVAELFASRGAAQDTQIFTIATEVDADQRAELARMRALRATIAGG